MSMSGGEGGPSAEQVFEVFTAYAQNEVRERQARRRVVAFLAGETLADFICENVVLAALVRGLANTEVTVIHAAEEPERAFIAGCNPYVEETMAVGSGEPFTALLDWFDAGMDAPVRCPEAAWAGRGLGAPDLLLVPGALGASPAHLAGLAEAPPTFRLPKGADDPSALIARGVGPEAWFAGIHGLDVETQCGLERAVQEQGGVVIPLDDAPLADRATVLTHARFVVGTDAALAAMASAFRVPSVFLGPAERRWPVWNREDILVGSRSLGPGDFGTLVGQLVASTAGCTGWRSPAEEVGVVPVDGIVPPPPVREAPLCQVWPV